MIKCNRCGNMTPEGPMCQFCGTPLSSKNDAGPSQRTGAQEQAELPAWLESLRVGERAAPHTGGSLNFSTADFMEEGPLPSWMRSERAEANESSSMPTAAPEHLSAFPGQVPDGGNLPPSGFAAQSLIDEKSLPAWMKEGQQTPPPAPGGLSASSLLQQDDVPNWMKTLQEPDATPAPYQERAGQPEQASKAAPLPSSNNLGPGFSARDLLDQQALPSWMKPGSEQNTSMPQHESFEQSGQITPVPQSGFSASSLLDAEALPQWMREGGQNSYSNAAPSQPSWPTQAPSGMGWPESSSSPSWSVGQNSSMATPPPIQTGQGSGLPASSFVDANALPEWLRNAANQSPQAMQPSQLGLSGPRQGSYAVPPRGENVRVPSRPRGNEPGASDSSEVAANVFASMLGVASNSPNQPQQAYQQPTQVSQPGQLNQAMGQMGQPSMPSGSFAGPHAIANTPLSMG
ncbi:MAG: hypothetical protein H0U76_14860, partial [Ktedonobacteraceae bacterium]|nr:hypothetical protein [Ktedonobacteraceae bacterium]